MNETTGLASEGPLEWSRIVVRGPESEQFLQGQLSQDVSRVPDGGLEALVLEPDSVVIASVHVTTLEDGFALTLPRALGDVVLARLRRFLLRTKCSLELDDVASGPYATVDEQVCAGVPGPAEFARSLTPHSFGPSFVAATISFTKGCFTGQELVGRLDARGSSVPWRLVRGAGATVERIAEVLASKGPAGPQGVTSVARGDDSVTVLGIAHRTLLDETWLAQYPDVRVEPVT
jgi:folate-binding Fe-S cluster repair protein YgfZ